MNEPNYRIQVDKSIHLLTICVLGYWDNTTLTRYQLEIEQTLAKLGFPEVECRILVDIRGAVVQSQDIAAALQSFHKTIGQRVGRIAVVVSAALQKMQSVRISSRGSEIIFNNMDEAKAWLLSAVS